MKDWKQNDKVLLRELIQSELKTGELLITFNKKDGTERKLKCTLQEGVVQPYEKKTEQVKVKNDNTMSVWDIENSGWRSFNLDSITQIEGQL